MEEKIYYLEARAHISHMFDTYVDKVSRDERVEHYDVRKTVQELWSHLFPHLKG